MTYSNKDILKLMKSSSESIKFIITLTSFLILILIVILLSIDNKYESKAILHATEKESDLASMAGQFSGLAAMAGVTVPGSDEISSSDVALEVLRSEDFFIRLYEYEEFLPNLLAYDKFDATTKMSSYKNKVYDSTESKWIRKVSYPKQQIPSLREAYNEFYKNHFSISKDEKSGIITLTIVHESPVIAQDWLNFLVANINDYMQTSEVERAIKALDFLRDQMLTTQNNELMEVLAGMAEAKIQTVMLSEVSDEFVFRSIQKPTFSNFKKSPNRSYLTIFFSLFFGFLSLSIAIFFASQDKKVTLNIIPPRLYLEDI